MGAAAVKFEALGLNSKVSVGKAFLGKVFGKLQM